MLRKRLRSGVMTGGNPLGDLAALATIAFGYPIFRDGAKTLGPGKKATDDTLISIAVIASLLMRESITGLSVVVLIRLGRSAGGHDHPALPRGHQRAHGLHAVGGLARDRGAGCPARGRQRRAPW
jgi:hypothetical protein